MKDEVKTKAELIKELKILRKELEKSIIKDITERMQAEEKLIKNEKLCKEIQSLAHIGHWDYESCDDIITWSDELYSIFEINKDAGPLSIEDFLEHIHPEDRDTISKQIEKGESYRSDYRIIMNNGSVKHIHEEILIERQEDGKIVLMKGTAQDITERKQAEQALKESEEKYRTVFENTGTATGILEEDTVISLANNGFERLSGYSKEEIENKMKWTDFVIPEDLERMKKYHIARRKVGGKAPTEYEFSFIGKKSVIKNIFLKIDIIPGTKKSVASLMDITERKQAEEKLQEAHQRLKKNMNATLEIMSRIIEAKDPYTSGHQHRVCQLTVPLAQELNLSPDKVEGIRIASLIHDIGKIGLPTEILSKPTKLTDIEFSLIKDHSQIGYDILKSIEFSYPVARIILQHHERLDGSGYPNNLKADEITLEAKIIGVADVVEAMSSFRPYRPALGIDAALEEISKNRGILYDPKVVDACLKLFKEKGFKFES